MPSKTVSDEDIRRAYYDKAGYSNWITEMQLDPLQLVVCDDATGKHFRVPVAISKGALTFGDPIEVAVQYVDASAARGGGSIVFASRSDSLDGLRPPVDHGAIETVPASTPLTATSTTTSGSAHTYTGSALDTLQGAEALDKGQNLTPGQAAALINQAATRARVREVANQTPAAVTTAGGPSHTEGATNMAFDREKIREALGLGPDATDEAVQTAWAAAFTSPTPATSATAASVTTPATPAPETAPAATNLSGLAAAASRMGVVLIDPGQLDEMKAMAARGAQAYETQRRNERGTEIDAALKVGKIALSRKEHWEKAWDADPEGTRQMLAGLAPNMVPMEADGYAGAAASNEADLTYFAAYPEDKPKTGVRR